MDLRRIKGGIGRKDRERTVQGLQKDRVGIAAHRSSDGSDRPATDTRMETDLWWAADKAEHFVACWIVTFVLYEVVGKWTKLEQLKVGLAVGGSLTVGLLKEVGDHLGWWSGNWSHKDLVADGLGCASGVATVLALKMLKRRRKHKAETKYTPVLKGIQIE